MEYMLRDRSYKIKAEEIHLYKSFRRARIWLMRNKHMDERTFLN